MIGGIERLSSSRNYGRSLMVHEMGRYGKQGLSQCSSKVIAERTQRDVSHTFTVGTKQYDSHSRVGQPHDLLLDGFEVDLFVVSHGGDEGSVDAIVKRSRSGGGAVGVAVGLSGGRHGDEVRSR